MVATGNTTLLNDTLLKGARAKIAAQIRDVEQRRQKRAEAIEQLRARDAVLCLEQARDAVRIGTLRRQLADAADDEIVGDATTPPTGFAASGSLDQELLTPQESIAARRIDTTDSQLPDDGQYMADEDLPRFADVQ